MENCPLRFCSIGQSYPESIVDAKPRFWQTGGTSVSRTEIICPEPHRATGVPFALDGLNRFGSKSKNILPVHRGPHNMEMLDFILCKDEFEIDSSDAAENEMSFLCGSPPVRTSNPVVQDAEFAKLTLLPASPLGSNGAKPSRPDKGSPSCGSLLTLLPASPLVSNGAKPSRPDKGSPSCGSPLRAKPTVRVEGFACGSPESTRAVPAMA